jgi:ABC-type transport system involved in resistance to organic solvents, auxiliary component
MLRILIGFFALVMSTQTVFAASPDLAPDVLARTTSQEVLTLLKTDKDIQSGNMKKVYELVESKILPNFDFNRMTQLAVGKYWPGASAQQKQALVSEFRNLLVRTYASSLTAFSNQTVEFKPLARKPTDTDVTVRSEVSQPGGQPIPINYSMYKTAYGWKVYDVSIDGVSLVTNYRGSFGATIRRSGIDGLLKQLASKSEQAGRAAPKKAGG